MGVGKTLQGRTLGLYGYGRIAKTVETYSQAFGMKVIWWSSEEGRKRAIADGKTVAESREAFFSTPDVVSVHVRLKPTTKGVITAQDLGQMRPDALFINTSRAGLIAPGAMLSALNAGRPERAALDVFDVEPITWNENPLLAHPNVTCTPHIGFVTEDEFELQFSDVFDQVATYRCGAPIHMINPSVWPEKSVPK
jgi:D-3-phosphoglycerate dehydrogenase